MTRDALSVVIPAHNEAPSLRELIPELLGVLEACGREWEVLVVDDGSADDTGAVIEGLAGAHPGVRAIRLPYRQGKAAALTAGFRAARGRVILTLDADLQDHPADIPRFLDALDAGSDLVCGWKKPRRDHWLRRASSWIFNLGTSLLLGPRLHDHNCGFKAYRREVLDHVRIYGDLHRFATFLAHGHGFRVAEIVVTHRPRAYGRSRYGIERAWRSLFDLLTVSLLTRRRRRVFRFFTAVGMPIAAAGLALALNLFFGGIGADFAQRPQFLAGVLGFMLGVQMLAAGLVGELILGVWWAARAGRARRGDLVSVGGAGAAEAAAAPGIFNGMHVEVTTPAAPAVGGERFVVVERGGAQDARDVVARLGAAGDRLLVGASGRACAASSALIEKFPGVPATVAELAVWCGAAGIGVRRLDAGGIERPWRPSWITRVSHVALQFLARYQTRPLHFFGSLGAAFAALGVAGGLGIKCSAMDGPARYLLMELALGFAVAGMELFVAGLVGELLAYLRSAIEADRGGPPEN